jgi:alginate O-acetyltransferase complex protein AlgI
MTPDAPLFLYYFLPAVLAIFFLCPRPGRVWVLLAASLAYYFLADAAGLVVLAGATGANYLLARAMGPASPRGRATLAGLGVAANIGLLAFYKYGPLAAPLGISFFTFQAVAYLVDVRRGTTPAEPNLARFSLAMALFPKITAGPIARFGPLLADMGRLSPTLDDFCQGAWRFTLGLAKKMLIASSLAPLADAAFAKVGGPDMGTAWLGLVCYTAQLYFDFSGYTDMALGLGRMFGLSLPENFDHPYISRSVREFWRRWHISLSVWFRDYLYIPLGGSRVAPWRVRCNLLAVFTLCGVWHGASLNFLVWGLWHGLFLALERTRFGRRLDAAPAAVRHGYALLAVMLGWVLFRAPDLPGAAAYFRGLFSFSLDGFAYTLATGITRANMTALAAAVLFSLPLAGLWDRCLARFDDSRRELVTGLARSVALPLLFAAAAMQLAAGTFSPFIYARF